MSVRILLVDDSIITSTTISLNNDEYQLYARTLACSFPLYLDTLLRRPSMSDNDEDGFLTQVLQKLTTAKLDVTRLTKELKVAVGEVGRFPLCLLILTRRCGSRDTARQASKRA